MFSADGTDFRRNCSETSPEAGPVSWFALQVRGRQEFNISENLGSNGYEWFLPLYKSRKRCSDRIKQFDSPLFPGYVFCRFNPLDRLPILKIPGVIQIVGFNRQLVAVDEDEIRGIQALVALGIPNHPCPYLEVGDKVRIESGPLRGLEGLLVDFQGNHQLVLSVTLLQRSVAVKIDSASVSSVRNSVASRAERAYSEPRGMRLAFQP